MRFPYITDYINQAFEREKQRWDFWLLRPLLIVNYFFLRFLLFPIKFLIHRRPWGFEGYCIDTLLAVGAKYLASPEAAELFVRHVQIEPLVYRHLLSGSEYAESQDDETPRSLNGVYGDFSVESLGQLCWSGLTIGHDELSYEIGDHFSKEEFLKNLDQIRATRPVDHASFAKTALEENKRCSLRLLGSTNIVILIVTTITIFADLRTAVRALNSFDSDAIVLWCMQALYRNDPQVLADLTFYMPNVHNRGHYHSSVFFSDPSQYLYYHIAFDEYVYETLRNRPPTAA